MARPLYQWVDLNDFRPKTPGTSATPPTQNAQLDAGWTREGEAGAGAAGADNANPASPADAQAMAGRFGDFMAGIATGGLGLVGKVGMGLIGNLSKEQDLSTAAGNTAKSVAKNAVMDSIMDGIGLNGFGKTAAKLGMGLISSSVNDQPPGVPNGYGTLDGTTTESTGPGTIGSRDTYGSNEPAVDVGGWSSGGVGPDGFGGGGFGGLEIGRASCRERV